MLDNLKPTSSTPSAAAKKKPNWKKKADDMWSLCIRIKHQKCECCKKPGWRTSKGFNIGGLNAHHVIGRSNMRFRHNLRNGQCLCIRCHKWNPLCSPHMGGFKAGVGYQRWMEDKKPVQWAWYEKNQNIRGRSQYTHEDDYHFLKNLLNTQEFDKYM